MVAKKTHKKGKARAGSGTSSAGKGGARPTFELTSRRRTLLVVVSMLMAVVLLYPELAFQGKIFMAKDVEAATSFAKAAHKVMIEEHVYPLWNPYLFSGMPSYESLAYNPFVYPLSFVTGFLISKLHFPPNSWLLFHMFLLGIGVTLLLLDRGVSLVPSIMAGVFMIWMPNVVAIGANGHGSQASAIAYMPYALLFWDRITRGKGIILNASLLAIVLGFQMLRAHIQISYYTYAMLGLHFLFFSVLRMIDASRGGGSKTESTSIIPFRRAPGTPAEYDSKTALLDSGFLFAVLGAVVVCSLLISSVLYLPVHEYSQYSIRGGSVKGGLEYDYATSWSLHPLETLTFVLPYAFGFGKDTYIGYMPFTDYPNYLGLVVFLGALAGIFLVKDRFVRFLVFLAAVSTLVAFGRHFPVLYDPLFKWMPYFNKFRVPVMVLVVQQLSVAALFAFGLQALTRVPGDKARRIALIGGGAFAVLLLVAVISQGYWKDGFARAVAGRIKTASSVRDQIALGRVTGEMLLKDLVKTGIMGAALFGFLFMYARKMIPRAVFVSLVLVTALVDYRMVDANITHPEKLFKSEAVRLIKDPAVLDRYLEPDPVVDFLKRDKGFYRIMPMYHPSAPFYGEFTSNRYMNFGISSIGGYHAAKLAAYNNLLKALGGALGTGHYQLLDMLNVKYLISAYRFGKGGRFEPVWSGKNWEGETRFIYRNNDALDRAFLVDRYQIVHHDEALALLKGSDINPAETALLEKRPPIEPVSKKGGKVEITSFSFNEIHMQADVPSPCLLVASEVYYPRWKVYVDGKENEMLRADYLLRAVALPAGRHEVVFKYDSSHIKRAFHISLTTFVLLLVLLIGSTTWSRKRWKHSS
jgi:hypothetical protein